MFKTLTAGITALSLVVPHSASAAQNNDIGKFIVGLAAVAIIGAAIDATSRQPAPVVAEPRPNERNQDRIRGNRVEPLPSQCRVQIPGRHGVTEIYGQRCLTRNFSRADRLPEVCAVRVQGEHRDRRGYAPDCLRQFGYVEEWAGRTRLPNH